MGAGISGLVCAYLLSEAHDVVLFEREPRLGGHTNTVSVSHEGREIPVDTGFIVFNERNYPNFCALLKRLGVASRPTTMSFSVRDHARDFEYGGTSLAGAVGTLSNLLSPRWWRICRGVASLGSTGRALLADVDETQTIGDLCRSGRVSPGFLDDYLLPMAAAIWSAPRDSILDFPAKFLLRFFDNHGMLDLRNRPQWRTIEGGSRRYIDAMLTTIGTSARVACSVERIERSSSGVTILAGGVSERFDEVVLAAHSDQSLTMLADPTPEERSILGELPYQPNEAILHTDVRQLPRRRRCWAAWNYRMTDDPARPVSVTYNMTILQRLDTRTPLCVTLNDADSIDPACIIGRFLYHHPLSSVAGERAKHRRDEISGVNRTQYCGAYWGNGFHEDGVASALHVCRRFGVGL